MTGRAAGPRRGQDGCARRPRRTDDGTVAPMILLFFLVAALMVMGASAAGSAFLAQRDLQSGCDAAALAAADALAPDAVYRGDRDLSAGLPLRSSTVNAAVARVAAGDAHGMSVAATTDGRGVAVRCRSVARIAFGSVFGYSRGLPRTARSDARAPARNR